jgi:hypothetical protein
MGIQTYFMVHRIWDKKKLKFYSNWSSLIIPGKIIHLKINCQIYHEMADVEMADVEMSNKEIHICNMCSHSVYDSFDSGPKAMGTPIIDIFNFFPSNTCGHEIYPGIQIVRTISNREEEHPSVVAWKKSILPDVFPVIIDGYTVTDSTTGRARSGLFVRYYTVQSMGVIMSLAVKHMEVEHCEFITNEIVGKYRLLHAFGYFERPLDITDMFINEDCMVTFTDILQPKSFDDCKNLGNMPLSWHRPIECVVGSRYEVDHYKASVWTIGMVIMCMVCRGVPNSEQKCRSTLQMVAYINKITPYTEAVMDVFEERRDMPVVARRFLRKTSQKSSFSPIYLDVHMKLFSHPMDISKPFLVPESMIGKFSGAIDEVPVCVQLLPRMMRLIPDERCALDGLCEEFNFIYDVPKYEIGLHSRFPAWHRARIVRFYWAMITGMPFVCNDIINVITEYWKVM